MTDKLTIAQHIERIAAIDRPCPTRAERSNFSLAVSELALAMVPYYDEPYFRAEPGPSPGCDLYLYRKAQLERLVTLAKLKRLIP